MGYTNREIIERMGHQKGLLQQTMDKIDLPATALVGSVHALIDPLLADSEHLDDGASEEVVAAADQLTRDAAALDARVLPE